MIKFKDILLLQMSLNNPHTRHCERSETISLSDSSIFFTSDLTWQSFTLTGIKPPGFTSKIFLLSAFLLLSNICPAQMFDTIREAVKTRPRFTFKLDSKNSFVNETRTEVVGFKLGVDFGKKLRIGGGYHELNTNFFKPVYLTGANGEPDTINAQLKLSYFAYYVEYVYYKSKRWKLSIPLQLGFGDSRYSYTFLEKRHSLNKHFVVLYEPAVAVEYTIFRWLGLGADIGLRVMAVNNKSIKENFNSPTYAFKLLIWYDELFISLFPKTKVAKWLQR